MLYGTIFVICFLASTVGAVCGIGGGVIIKPVLDGLGIISVSSVSFLSGCTVLMMAAYSVVRSILYNKREMSSKVGILLALGAAVGGLVGRWLFGFVLSLSPDRDKVGAVQAICLLLVTVGTLIYTLCKGKICTLQVNSMMTCIAMAEHLE